MPTDVLILAATAILAVVALTAAVISVRNLKEVRKSIAATATPARTDQPSDVGPRNEPELLEPAGEGTAQATQSRPDVGSGELIKNPQSSSGSNQELVPHHGQVARVVDGKVVVTPTRSQVAHAIMGQPRVRFAIWMTGFVHALRPESRDRIVGMMRRDYRQRRRHREQVARAAIRSAHSPATRADEARGYE